MKLVSLLALVALVVSCHLDKLLNAGKTPPSEAPPARVAFSSPPSSARAGEPINPPVQVTVQDSAGHVTLRDTLVILSLGANPSGDSLRGDTVAHSVNGVATFVNVRLDKAARGYRLAAVAPELHPDTSPAFSVMPAPATVLAFTVPPTGSLAVTTSTSGATPDPDGYAYSVDGATPQPIADNQTITLTGVATGSHTVVLSGLAGNCTVSGGTSRTVTVTAGQTVTASFTISCPTPPPPNVAPVVNAGSDDHALTGLLYSFSWSFSDGNHNGPS